MARLLAEGTGASVPRVVPRGFRCARRDRGRNGGCPVRAGPPLGDEFPRSTSRHRAPVRRRGELLGALTISKQPAEQADVPPPRRSSCRPRCPGGASPLELPTDRVSSARRGSGWSRPRTRSAGRLERDLHDGAQQQLVALAVKQRLAEGLVRKQVPQRARSVLTQAQADTVDALETLRDLARGSTRRSSRTADWPPRWKRRSGERRSRAGRRGWDREVRPGGRGCRVLLLSRGPAERDEIRGGVDGGVRLGARDGRLTFIVSDDGAGFDPSSIPRGTGLQGMADRLEALGGELEIR